MHIIVSVIVIDTAIVIVIVIFIIIIDYWHSKNQLVISRNVLEQSQNVVSKSIQIHGLSLTNRCKRFWQA